MERSATQESTSPAGGNGTRPDRTDSWFYGLVARLGALRVFFAAIVLACLPMAFFATGEARGWGTLSYYVAPALVVLLAWVLLFDMLMARVLMGEHHEHGETRNRYRTILRVDAILLGGLLVFWGPFYVSLLS